MKAMIFAAGLGTRLRPLTNDRPKALVALGGVTLLERVIRKVIAAGFNEIIVNVHHYADDVIQFLKKKNHFDVKIHVSDERKLLLETGGALKKAAHFFKDGAPFLVHNTDIISSINLQQLYQKHITSKAMATLAVRNRETSRYLLFDEAQQLTGWTNVKTGEQKFSRITKTQLWARAFSGIHVIDPTIFSYFPEQEIFSIIDVYLKAAVKETILAYLHDEDQWLDVGKPEQLKQAEKIISTTT